MSFLGLGGFDWCVLVAYFAAVIYLGVFLGGKKTKNLGDFFVAGGRWGPLVSFIFVFASALAGNEAVVVSKGAYISGLAGFWLWGNFIFATPIYFLFATYYRRARVYNLAEFLEMRYGAGVAALYSVVAGFICLLFIGMFLLAVARILGGALDFPVQPCIWVIALIVAAYVYSGGMMSTLITDLLQGLMCLFILGFLFLPFLWNAAGGFEALQSRPPETWNFTGPGMELSKVIALCLTTITGGIAAPWIYNWIAVSKNEQAATQCAWAHLWKRVATLMFTLYGILFVILLPNISEDPEMAWGLAMKAVLPTGAMGLMIATFFAAAMSSTATYATTSAAMLVDYFYRKIVQPDLPREQYLTIARYWVVASIVLAAASTYVISEIEDYVKLCLSLLCFLGIPIYFGVAWRRANRTGMWLSMALGVGSFLTTYFMPIGPGHFFENSDAAFSTGVFVSTSLSLMGMIVGTLWGPAENAILLNRFYVIMNTPIGDEHRLVKAGISLPALVDAKLVGPEEEQLRPDIVHELYRQDSQAKIFGPDSSLELRREGIPWYYKGFIRITIACILLIIGTWLVTRILFVWDWH
ncbi:MAG: sodium:solute symporter family protein [Pirellulales bacterium]